MTVPHPLFFFFSFHRQLEWASDFYVATATSTACQKSRSVSSADGSRRNADHGATGRRCTLWLRLCAFTRHCIVAGESHSCHVLNRCAMGTSKRHTKLMPTPRAAMTKKHWWTDRKLKSEEEEWETEHERNRIQKRTRKLRSSLSLPVDIGYSRLARAFKDKKKKKKNREKPRNVFFLMCSSTGREKKQSNYPEQLFCLASPPTMPAVLK